MFLFCDEPTTGLDSYSAYTVVKTLRHLCTKQRLEKNSISSLYDETSSSNTSEGSPAGSYIEMEKVLNIDDILPKPLTGASEVSARRILGRLKKSVICSIHQPTSDIFELFTDVILMDAGRIIYQGSTKSAYDFFTK